MTISLAPSSKSTELEMFVIGSSTRATENLRLDGRYVENTNRLCSPRSEVISSESRFAPSASVSKAFRREHPALAFTQFKVCAACCGIVLPSALSFELYSRRMENEIGNAALSR